MQVPRNDLTVAPARITAPTEPVRQLFRGAIHLFAQIDQIKSMTLLVPGQLTDQIVGTGAGIDAEEGDELRLIAKLRLKSMLPVPDTGGSDADDFGDIFLVQAKFKSAPPQVVAKGDGGR